ncbi:MAG TPA: hypothetical protein VF221_13600 [Chloroflexota bacterium]
MAYDRGPSAGHFALSDTLARVSITPTIWWHSADEPTLILGGAQQSSEIDLEACAAVGVHVVQRQAGGTAVYASPDVLGLDVALPPGHELIKPDVVESYRWLGDVWATTLRSLRVDAHVVGIEEARRAPPVAAEVLSALKMACFGTLSPFEVTAEGRKIVGLAQVRRRGAELLQNAIHLHFDAESLVQLLSIGDHRQVSDELRRAAVGLNDVTQSTGNVTHVIEAFEHTLALQMGIRLVDGILTEYELAHLNGQVGAGSAGGGP